MSRVTQGKVSVLAVVIDTDIFLHRDASRNGDGVHFKQQGPRASLLGSLPRFLVQSPPTHPQEIRKGAALCHRHSDLFDEAGQVYVPFGETSTLVGAQGDVDLKERRAKVQRQASVLPGRARGPPAMFPAPKGTAG